MPFNTYTFIIFFLIVLILHYSLNNWKLQKINLVIASYIFYSAWNPFFVLLLFFSTVCDWLIAGLIYRSINIPTKKYLLIICLCINLGLLGYFKYGEFLLDTFIDLLEMTGLHFTPLAPNILLPVGISFYTFQTMSYTIDVYRSRIKPASSFIDYALYVSFFPQLVAGPIVRADAFLPQCELPKRANKNQFGWGLALMVIGLFMKIVLSDKLFAPIVDKVFSTPDGSAGIEIWTALFCFSGQIYCDFAGYSTVAIGTALCLGFILPDNFMAPYAAIGFRDFWHRWHISLSTWLRDYLYISLGGSRISETRTLVNLMLTMLIGGLWHGASWMFVIWGGLHGIYLVCENRCRKLFSNIKKLHIFTELVLVLFTFVVTSFTWIFFRSQNITEVKTLLVNLTRRSSNQILTNADIRNLLLLIFMLVAWQYFRRYRNIENIFSSMPSVIRGVILFILSMTIFLFAGGDDRAFIYFQF